MRGSGAHRVLYFKDLSAAVDSLWTPPVDVERFDPFADALLGAPLDDALILAVREAVDTQLTKKQREVVEAHFFEGASQSEIARRLGVSQQVVHKRIYGVSRDGREVGGALRRLRDSLASLAVFRRSKYARTLHDVEERSPCHVSSAAAIDAVEP